MNKIKQMFNDLALQKKLILSYILLGIAPLLVMGFLGYRQISNLIIEQEYENMESFLIQAKLTLENEINIYDNLSNYLAFNNDIKSVIELSANNEDKYDIYTKYRDILDPTVSSMSYFHSDLDQITYYIPNIAVDYDDTLVNFDQAKEQSWYDEVMADSNIHWFIANERIFSIRKVYINPNLMAILFIEPKFENLIATLTSALPENCALAIDSYGTLVYSYNSFDDIYPVADLSDVDNSNYLKKTEMIGNSEWNLNIYRPAKSAVTNLIPIVLSILTTVAIIALATLLALYFISKYIVHRVHNLALEMKKVEDGNFDIDLESRDQDEIGQLIRGFSQMTQRINKLINDLYISKLHQKEYELKALQQQINPHFLYNTLSMINFKAIQSNNPDISRITLSLSSFYRTALNQGDNVCSIASEIGNIKAYIDLQLMMHDYDFDAVIEIDDNLNDCETLNLILQPLIENAINHGIDLLKDRRGSIRVLGTISAETVYLIIEDNGVGMSQDTIDSILITSSKGYGVFNVQERIKLFYGKDYGIHIESIIDHGTIVTVIFPAKKYQRKQQ